MALSPQWLDELRARISLSGVIGRTTRLTKAGHEFKACCPFHNEKSPSFTVNDAKGFYHCLAGETLVHTDQGRFAIRELAGTTARVMTRGGVWVEAPFREYGTQPLLRIELSRNRQRKTVFATAGHRWFIRGRKSALTTADLRSGHRLESALPVPRLDWTLDPEGVRHGIVFGDGTLYQKTYGTLNLHGAKDQQLVRWFPDQSPQFKLRDGGQEYVRVYGGRAFGHMKRLPDRGASDAYLLGFLAGYLAADGHVAKDGTVMLNSADGAALDAIRDLADRLGIATYGRTTQFRRGLGAKDSALHRIHFVGSRLDEHLFLLDEARQRFRDRKPAFERTRWHVQSVTVSERVEPVYCAEVPDHHAFVIEDNILTGNCFGCGAHGDAIRWMTDQRGLSFMDAVKELAAEAGLEVPAPDPRAAQIAEQRDSLHDVMAAAQAWFVEQLAGADGARARGYLATRGFDAHTTSRFGFGYAPEGRQALKAALSKFPEAMLIEAGLRIAVDDKEPYDRFRGRLMLPIEDARGRVIAFGGRILDAQKTDAPKYLNSPDTPLFDKGRTLYNLHRAGPASRQSGRLIVVEGYMDVIALAAAGIAEAVAPLGTALTERQIELLWRLVEAPILCFDGDAAGQRAAMRAVTRALPMLRPAHSLRIVRLPSGMDPDDLLKQQGRAGLEKILGEPAGLLDTLWQHERDAVPLTTPEDKAGLKARLMAHVETINDPDIKALYRRELTDRFSEFAFPKRESTWQPGGGQFGGQFGGQSRGQSSWKPGQRGKPPQQRSDPRSIQSMRHASGSGARDEMALSIIAGLLRWPGELAAHADVLARSSLDDARLDAMLDISFSGEPLEPDRIATILASRGLSSPTPGECGPVQFPFLDDGADPEIAREALSALISKVVEEPQIDQALRLATEQFDIVEQERLRKRKENINERFRLVRAQTND